MLDSKPIPFHLPIQKPILFHRTTNATTTPFTAPTQTPTQSADAQTNNNTGAIVGGVVGGLAFCVIAAVAAIFLLRKRKAKQHIPDSREDWAQEISDQNIYSPPHTIEHRPQTDDKIAMSETGDITFEKPGAYEKPCEVEDVQLKEPSSD